jgi:hypothetical protein
VDRVALGRHAELFGADPHQRTDVARLKVVGAHNFALGGFERGLVERHGHLEDLGRVEQAARVLLEAENRGAFRRLVGAHAFKYAHAVMQRVREYVNLCVTPLNQLAIHPDLAVAICHRHGRLLCSQVNVAKAPL